jgi:hypothetical protein
MRVKGRLHVSVALPVGEELSGLQGRSGKENITAPVGN